MNPHRREYLNLQTKPGRVTAEEAGWHLGFATHEISILISAGVLQPLGNPAENGVKFFLSWELDQLNKDRAWFSKASDTIIQYWKDRNLQRVALNAKKRWPHRFVPKALRGKPLPKPPAAAQPVSATTSSPPAAGAALPAPPKAARHPKPAADAGSAKPTQPAKTNDNTPRQSRPKRPQSSS